LPAGFSASAPPRRPATIGRWSAGPHFAADISPCPKVVPILSRAWTPSGKFPEGVTPLSCRSFAAAYSIGSSAQRRHTENPDAFGRIRVLVSLVFFEAAYVC
jgi:hypothetical protein